MAHTPRGSLVGIILRRLDADEERRQALRLLANGAPTHPDAPCVWYGLCDLTVSDTSGPVAVAVVCTAEPGVARLCGLAVAGPYRHRRLGRRLVYEVADRLRASGFEEVTAPAALGPPIGALLEQSGFVPRDDPRGGGPGWWLSL